MRKFHIFENSHIMVYVTVRLRPITISKPLENRLDTFRDTEKELKLTQTDKQTDRQTDMYIIFIGSVVKISVSKYFPHINEYLIVFTLVGTACHSTVFRRFTSNLSNFYHCKITLCLKKKTYWHVLSLNGSSASLFGA